MVTALTLLTFLFVAHAQEVGASTIPQKLEQELAAMESAFGSVQDVMAEVITEVKGNMADIETFNGKVKDLLDVVSAVSVEIKQAEGKIIGLRTDLDSLGAGHEALRARVDALEGGLTELASFCDLLKSRLDVQDSDLGALRGEFDALVDSFGAHMKDYAGFREQLATDLLSMDAAYQTKFSDLETGLGSSLDGLRTELYAGMDALQSGLYGEIDGLRSSLSTDIMTMESTFTSDMTLIESQYGDLAGRLQKLEDEDVGTFKKKVLELERSMAALAIKVDNNRAKLEGFDQAIATLSSDMATTKDGILQANKELLGQYDVRLQAVEDNAAYLKTQIDTLYFISIVALLAGVGALIWGFLGTSG
jgi:chromosome segregation ATPase